MRGALLILKKEFLELSKDRKTLFFTFVMPFLLWPLMFLMLTKMGQNDAAKRKGQASRVYLVDPGAVLAPRLKAQEKLFTLVERPQGDFKQALKDQKLEMVVEVDPGAAALILRSETIEVKALVDESERSSSLALKRLKETMQAMDKELIGTRLKALGASAQLAEPSRVTTTNAADTGLEIAKILGSFLPYILMIMVFTGAMQHGIYATAGERERGTLQTLLATRLPRSQIIWGKLLYIFCMGLFAALMNLASIGFAFAKLIGGAAAEGGRGGAGLASLSSIADPSTLGLSLLLMLPLALFFSNFILLGGIQAKNTVEAGTALTPGIFVVVFLGVFSMAPGLEKMAFLPYVPIVNVSLAIRKLFAQQGNAVEYLIAFGMTVGLAALMTWLSTRILNRESAIFKV
jgi:sodium transport system permease protein